MQHKSSSSETATEGSRECRTLGESDASVFTEDVGDGTDSSVGLEVCAEDSSDTELRTRLETLRFSGDSPT